MKNKFALILWIAGGVVVVAGSSYYLGNRNSGVSSGVASVASSSMAAVPAM